MLNDPHSRIVISSDCEKSLLFEAQGLTLSLHVPCTSTLSSSVFHAARTLSGSLRSPPSSRGEGFVRRYSFSTYACIRSDVMGEAVFSYRSPPHWGRGTAPAVDRVLSYIGYLRRSPSLFFIPLSPSNLRPFGAPPSIGRRECPREPLPLEGAAERSEAGLASFLGGEAATTTLNLEPFILNPFSYCKTQMNSL